MRHRLIALVPLAALVVTACGAAASPSPSPTPPPSPSAGSLSPPASTTPSASELERAEAGEFKGTSVEILGQWIGTEGDNFQKTLQPFVERTGINVVYGGLSNYETVLTVRVEGGNAPDLAQLAQPGTMRAFAKAGKLVDLGSVLDRAAVERDFGPYLDLGSYEGKLYGLFFRANAKSIVWYPVKAFEAKGYEIPETWEELLALSDRIVADGSNPWCISIEHKDVSGWVATDWLEDILLRTAPPETYDRWVNHQIPFNDPAVLRAAELMAKIWFGPNYVYGGTTYINATWVGDTQTPMFDPAGPKCWLHKQAAWIPDFWPKDADGNPLFKPGVDSAFFYFPPIDPQYGRPVLGAGDQFVMFNDRPEVRAVLQHLATPEAAKGWIEAGGFVAANKSVPTSWYTRYPDSGIAEIIATATTLRFDASDSMPAQVGGAGGSFLKGMVEWVAANGANTEAIFAKIEQSWPSQ